MKKLPSLKSRPRLIFLEGTGLHGRQLRRPFWPTSHCEKASGMCLGLTGSLWRFQKWCEKFKSDEKWPSYRDLKITNCYESERYWWQQCARIIIRTLFRPPPLDRNSWPVKVGNFQISVTLSFLVRIDYYLSHIGWNSLWLNEIFKVGGQGINLRTCCSAVVSQK